MLWERESGCYFLIYVYAQPWQIVGPQVSIPDLRTTGEYVPRLLPEKVLLLNAEVVARQIQSQIGGMTNRRYIPWAVPRCPYTEELAQCCQFARRANATDLG
jgi:hypothetical protein